MSLRSKTNFLQSAFKTAGSLPMIPITRIKNSFDVVMEAFLGIIILDFVYAYSIGPIITALTSANSSMTKFPGSQALIPVVVVLLTLGVALANILILKVAISIGRSGVRGR